MQDVYAQVIVERECRFLDRKLRKKQRRRIRIAHKKSQGAEDKVKRVIRDSRYKTAHSPTALQNLTRRPIDGGCTAMLRHGMFATRLIQTASDYAELSGAPRLTPPNSVGS